MSTSPRNPRPHRWTFPFEPVITTATFRGEEDTTADGARLRRVSRCLSRAGRTRIHGVVFYVPTAVALLLSSGMSFSNSVVLPLLDRPTMDTMGIMESSSCRFYSYGLHRRLFFFPEHRSFAPSMVHRPGEWKPGRLQPMDGSPHPAVSR